MKEKSEERNELQINRGKKPNQKLKPYLVLQFLLRETDESNVVTADEIVAYLNEIGIDRKDNRPHYIKAARCFKYRALRRVMPY